MGPVTTLTTLVLKTLAAVLLGWTAWRASRSRQQPSADPFVLLVATLTLWAVCSFGAAVPGVATVSLLEAFFDLARLGAILFLPVAWTVYALSYAGRGTGVTRKRIALLSGVVLPVVVSAIALASDSSERAIEGVIAFAFGWALLYGLALFLYATYLLIDLGRNQPRVSNTQLTVLTVGVAAPSILSVADNGTQLVGGTTLGLLLSGVLLAAASRRYPVMTGFPKADYVARARVVETLQEALVVLDWDDHVLDVNETAAELFGGPTERMIGDPVRSVIDGLDGTALPPEATGTVALRTSKGRRRFQFSVSAVDEATTNDEDNPVARTVLLRDITDRETREQRLAVLNRILRHNVRNDLDVVLAYADHVDDEELRTGIRERTTTLLESSKKVREAEAVMIERTDAPEPVDLTDVANAVADAFRSEDGSAAISLTCPDELVISTHRTVLRRALSELVENALEHATTDSPRVELTVRAASDETVELSVADDGPGLPERERKILAAGTETQLQHGRGIGLWFVTWAVTQLGGEVQFRENDPEGSIVTIRLYASTGHAASTRA
ncbi:PAS domain-containing protein [Haloplanus salinus]|uniref:histidine kinase n=1 Tax=Haloplanus salinus TaxID=1126245 RepID=A0A368NAP7_9EURY|nr:ATP-binding protein [Haloplanus salinus]RCU46601.1 PAS domain-containing protein [Haloplanus salinus]